ncbi:MAG: family 1 glycosylhydrolase [Propionibacteriaceae bacterium]|jgi:beta-glucosidase|nr:family 1 glycosylhydrolase [Propionibacteriaceae bacterium]
MTTFPTDFLWGASGAPHQIEGNNVNSDWWYYEHVMPHLAGSGDADDSYHRYREDMHLLAQAGLTAYRFGVEWARVEPLPGEFSRAELAHYRRMIDTALELGLTPVITLHHFTSPRWFIEEGGWTGDTAIDRFASYVERVCDILGGVEWVCTINEPNIFVLMTRMSQALTGVVAAAKDAPANQSTDRQAIPRPQPEVSDRLIATHQAACEVLKRRTDAKVGWTVANQAFWTKPVNADYLAIEQYEREDRFLEGSRGDDFIGVQAYSTQEVDENGLVPATPSPDNTLVGTAYRPDALGIAVRHAWEVTGGVPILVTENGIATSDDQQRIAYTGEALRHLALAMSDGIDVRGYLHWSVLDNFEWGNWEPTFGLIGVDRETFERHPKPSLAWLGKVAQSNGVPLNEV